MRLTYPIVSDNSRNFIRLYDVLHPQEGISRPAVFIIDKQGRIVWNYVGYDAADRAPIATVLEQLQAIR